MAKYSSMLSVGIWNDHAAVGTPLQENVSRKREGWHVVKALLISCALCREDVRGEWRYCSSFTLGESQAGMDAGDMSTQREYYLANKRIL
jgi:threonine dehydrogenase-like Zn-dependent dehydrogenase